MRLSHGLVLIAALAACQRGPQIPPVADRLTAQNAIFDAQYESDLRNFPERATSYGDYRYNDKLTDYSLAAIVQRDSINRAFLSQLQAVDTTGFTDQDQLSHDLMVRILQQRIADFDLKEYGDADQSAGRRPYRPC